MTLGRSPTSGKDAVGVSRHPLGKSSHVRDQGPHQPHESHQSLRDVRATALPTPRGRLPTGRSGQRVTGVSGALTSMTLALVGSSAVRIATLRSESAPLPQTTVRVPRVKVTRLALLTVMPET